MVASPCYGDDVVYLCCWGTAVAAEVVVSVHDVESYASPAWWVLCVACGALPCGSLMRVAVGGSRDYLCAALLVADAGSSSHEVSPVRLRRSPGNTLLGSCTWLGS